MRDIGRAHPPLPALKVRLLPTGSLVGRLRAFAPGEAWLYSGSRRAAAELGALELAPATALTRARPRSALGAAGDHRPVLRRCPGARLDAGGISGPAAPAT